jgi:four helix bundle protein
MPNSPRPPVRDLKDLVAWQVAMDFAEAVYRKTKGFPKDEVFGLRMQLRRAAASVPSNIAEGHGRISRADYARFAAIARGSLKEAETHILLARRLDYFEDDDAGALLDLVTHVNRLLTGLRRSLRS